MELTGKLSWLILSTCAILGQAQCEGGNEVANIHTLIAGMQVLRTVAVSITQYGSTVYIGMAMGGSAL